MNLSRGRPRKTFDKAAAEAAHILDVASALYLGRRNKLRDMGFNEKTAIAYVVKKRRGLVGDLLGNEVRDLIRRKINLTVAAARLVTEHQMSVGQSVAAVLRTAGRGEVNPDRAEAFRGAVRQKVGKLQLERNASATLKRTHLISKKIPFADST